MIKLIYKIHVLIFGYPSRSEVRDAMNYKTYITRQEYDIGILYICGISIKETAIWLNISEDNIIKILNSIVKE